MQQVPNGGQLVDQVAAVVQHLIGGDLVLLSGIAIHGSQLALFTPQKIAGIHQEVQEVAFLPRVGDVIEKLPVGHLFPYRVFHPFPEFIVHDLHLDQGLEAGDPGIDDLFLPHMVFEFRVGQDLQAIGSDFPYLVPEKEALAVAGCFFDGQPEEFQVAQLFMSQVLGPTPVQHVEHILALKLFGELGHIILDIVVVHFSHHAVFDVHKLPGIGLEAYPAKPAVHQKVEAVGIIELQLLAFIAAPGGVVELFPILFGRQQGLGQHQFPVLIKPALQFPDLKFRQAG